MENWMAKLLKTIVTQMSPTIRSALVNFVKMMEVDAKKTDNPWDDIGIGILKFVLLIK